MTCYIRFEETKVNPSQKEEVVASRTYKGDYKQINNETVKEALLQSDDSKVTDEAKTDGYIALEDAPRPVRQTASKVANTHK